jgi:hypothetical protein
VQQGEVAPELQGEEEAELEQLGPWAAMRPLPADGDGRERGKQWRALAPTREGDSSGRCCVPSGSNAGT